MSQLGRVSTREYKGEVYKVSPQSLRALSRTEVYTIDIERLYSYWEKELYSTQFYALLLQGNKITIKGSAVRPGGEPGKRPEPLNGKETANRDKTQNTRCGFAPRSYGIIR